ncbi:Kelch-like protein 20 [Channa argus]|uniref:Kelch-like protein 20 n=1 Tax=Channa argus TaxID=215402 RepID=A0A6G1PZ99_CHAAH|nr:Kelch-like protein 20 [Channa argus]
MLMVAVHDKWSHWSRPGPREPEPQRVLIKENQEECECQAPLSLARGPRKLPPKRGINEKMFVVGGWTQDDPSCAVEQFCPEYNEWRTATYMVNSRGQVAVGTLDGQIYTAGGEDKVRCYSSVESNRQTSERCCNYGFNERFRLIFWHDVTRMKVFITSRRYNPDTGSWSTDVAPLSSPRSGACLVAMDGYLYAIGGHDSTTALNTMERYDPKMDTWSKQPPMLTRRTRAVAAVLESHLYVIGGNDGDMALSSVERYNPVDGTWSICAHMLSPRENAGCAVYMGHVYVAGGKDELSLEVSTAEKFNTDTMRWTPVKSMRNKRDNVSNGSL